MSHSSEDAAKTRKYSLVEGAVFNGFFVITQGFLVTGLALQYGASELFIAIIGVLPTLAQVMQLLAPVVLQYAKSRRKAMLVTSAIARFGFALIPVTLAFGITNSSLLLTALAITALFNSLTGNFWLSLIRDAVPPEKTGRFFGIRNLFASMITLVMTVVHSLILDKLPGRMGFLIVTIIGAGFAALSVYLLKGHKDLPVKVYGTGRFFKEVMSNLKFRDFLFFAFIWNMGITLSAPFVSYHQLVNLQLDYSYLSVMSIIAGITSMVLFPLWGRIADEIGHQSVLEFGILGAAGVMFLWFTISPSNYAVLLPLDSILTGVVWSAINLCMFTTIMSLISGLRAEPYFAVLSFISGVAALVGSISGGLIAGLVKNVEIVVAGHTIFGVQFLFLGAAVMRATSWFFLRRVKTPKKQTVTRHVMNSASVFGRRLASRPYEYAASLIEIERQRRLQKKQKDSENTEHDA